MTDNPQMDYKYPIYIGPLYPCNHCNSMYISQDFLIKHQKKCILLNFNIIWKSKLNLNQNYFKSDSYLSSNEEENITEDYFCNKCFCGFIELADYKEHMNEYHPNTTSNDNLDVFHFHSGITIKKNQCKKCFKMFFNPFDLKSHKCENILTLSKQTKEKSLLVCKYCSKQFTKKGDYFVHIRNNHTNEKPHACYICPMTFIKKSTLNCHLNRHIISENQCIFCPMNFDNLDKLNSHLKSQHPEKEWMNCSLCSMKFSNIHELKVHCMIHSKKSIKEKNKFQREDCESFFMNKIKLNEHLRIDTGEMPYTCNICSKKFSFRNQMIYHKKCDHPEEKPFACNYCHFRTKTKTQLGVHVAYHSDEKPFACDQCPKRFKTKLDLKNHLITHSGEKPFECDICSKRFSRKSKLIEHFKTHTGEKPFGCNICSARFVQKIGLRNHIKSHMGVKPFSCRYCQKNFCQKHVLIEHLRIHTGEKPFRCDSCSRDFSSKSVLRRHCRSSTHIKNQEKTFQKP